MHRGDGGTGWTSFSDLLVWNRLVLTDALMSHTTASKARRTRVTFRREASPLRRNANRNLRVITLPFMPCHATHMMKKVGLPPTVRRRDPSPDIAQCFNTETKKMVDYAWRPVTDGKLLGFLGSIACKKRGWFPYENGQCIGLSSSQSSPWS